MAGGTGGPAADAAEGGTAMIVTVAGYRLDTRAEVVMDFHVAELCAALEEAVAIAQAYRDELSRGLQWNDGSADAKRLEPIDTRLAALTGGKGGAPCTT